jgi:hypothetical protein
MIGTMRGMYVIPPDNRHGLAASCTAENGQSAAVIRKFRKSSSI